jgi:hypothetical protein
MRIPHYFTTHTPIYLPLQRKASIPDYNGNAVTREIIILHSNSPLQAANQMAGWGYVERTGFKF